ncbi:MAG TPA: DUF2330 domain-containing protein [Actinobacteria bacterium]|nr:DUF2330 domain-containing protein [Actinomycetota bacterium]
MNKTKQAIILSIVIILLIPTMAFANKGLMTFEAVDLTESGQNAIVAWNGDEEVIVLSTDVKSSKSTLVLETLPLPSNPTKVEEGSFESFKKLNEIIARKYETIQKEKGIRAAGASNGVEITFHKKIGAHDVTVVKINDLDYFLDWVKKFTAEKGLKQKEISPKFKQTVAGYLEKNIRFFVFDVIETSENKQSIKPLVYRFKTDYLYYPMEITATSDAGQSYSAINIFLITKGIMSRSLLWNTGLWPVTGFDFFIELNKDELKEVSPEIAALFGSAYVVNAYHAGYLNELNKDLVVYSSDLHCLSSEIEKLPGELEKLSNELDKSRVDLEGKLINLMIIMSTGFFILIIFILFMYMKIRKTK